MNYKDQIEQLFGPNACGDGLFYLFPGGLRFELSEGGAPLDQVLTALRKTTAIFEFAFSNNDTILVCLRRFMGTNRFYLRRALRELALAGVTIPEKREYWLEPVEPENRRDENIDEWFAYVTFEFPAAQLPSLIWCAVVTDFSSIHPNPRCSIYVIDIEKRIMAHPYDDRGMDIIGPNFKLLSELYVQFNAQLLDYDRMTMDCTFNKLQLAPNGTAEPEY